jgi:hypothetical protein
MHRRELLNACAATWFPKYDDKVNLIRGLRKSSFLDCALGYQSRIADAGLADFDLFLCAGPYRMPSSAGSCSVPDLAGGSR